MTDIITLPPRRELRSRKQLPPVEPPRSIDTALRGPTLLGGLVILLFLGGFSAWAAFAPVASGAIAPGVVSPDGSRRTIQHFEGGIIAEIKVRDGDFVTKGQPVMELESVAASSNNEATRDAYFTAIAVHSRLLAEVSGANAIAFPVEILLDDRPRTVDILDGQRMIFNRHRAYLAAQREILSNQDAQLTQQAAAFASQIVSVQRQLELINREVTNKQSLYDKGLTTLPPLLLLQRQAAESEGSIDQYTASIAEIEQKRAEVALRLLSLDAEQNDTLARELGAARLELGTASERLEISEDILGRTIIAAPVSGQVMNSRFKSPGGVVQPAEPLMDVVPNEERLLIDARVSVSDIDIVRPGLAAIVHLSALASSRLPRINGTVASVSADRLTDPNTGQSYYLARVEVSPESLDLIGGSEQLQAGMPAEVLIVTSERTMIDYLLEPVLETFRRSFHEG